MTTVKFIAVLKPRANNQTHFVLNTQSNNWQPLKCNQHRKMKHSTIKCRLHTK